MRDVLIVLLLSLAAPVRAQVCQPASCAAGTFSVRSYGAIGDGVANDSTAFQAGLAAILACGGGVLEVPPGIYRIASWVPLIDSPGTTWPWLYIRGHGGASRLKVETGSSAAFYLGNMGHVVIEGLTIAGGALNYQGQHAHSVFFYGGESLSVRDVVVYGLTTEASVITFGSDAYPTSCADFTMERCWINAVSRLGPGVVQVPRAGRATIRDVIFRDYSNHCGYVSPNGALAWISLGEPGTSQGGSTSISTVNIERVGFDEGASPIKIAGVTRRWPYVRIADATALLPACSPPCGAFVDAANVDRLEVERVQLAVRGQAKAFDLKGVRHARLEAITRRQYLGGGDVMALHADAACSTLEVIDSGYSDGLTSVTSQAAVTVTRHQGVETRVTYP